MTEPVTISLHAWPKPGKEKDSIGYLIQRINAQKGSFRNVTEQSLEEDIRNEGQETAVLDSEDEEPGETEEDVEDLKSKRENLYKAKGEILQQVDHARNECALALDFVSALLTRYAPGPASLTLSPVLRQTLPSGSFGAEVVQVPKLSEAEQRNTELVSIGWRMQSLNGAANSLLKSATKLESEIAKETTYWDQVLAVKDQGWSLCRLPHAQRTLGVRYGFSEAYSDFRDRGLAALRRNDDGTLILDRGLRTSRNQTLRVRVLERGNPIACSVGTTAGRSEEDPLETQILQARNSIFDEELHHELHREARNLLNQGVSCQGSAVLLPFKGMKQIEIDLVPMDDDGNDQSRSDPTSEVTLVALRILLLHAHRQNLYLRSQPPPPLRKTAKPRPIYAILKPMVEYLQHNSNIDSLQQTLTSLRNTLRAAGLAAGGGAEELDPSITQSKSSFSDAIAASSLLPTPPKSSAIDTLLQTLTSPHDSTLHFRASPALSLTIDIYTNLLPPTCGTTYRCTAATKPTTTSEPHPVSSMPAETRFSSPSSLQKHILHLITLDILGGGRDVFRGWKGQFLHTNTVSKTNHGNKDLISLNVTPAKMGLVWQRMGFLGERGSWVWEAGDGNGRDDEPREQGLRGVVRGIEAK